MQALAATSVVLLQGCVGGADLADGVSMTNESQTPALASSSAKDVAEWLNSLYKGFDANNDASPLGVTISMQDSFGIYCTKMEGQTCYRGNADCRLSASLYNHKMMLDSTTRGMKLTMGRSAGIVFNQTLVQSSIGKCSYIFDGGSFNRFNGACGCLAATQSCEDPHSAFGNVCASTGKTCTVSDREVESCSCDAQGEPKETALGCFHKGAGYDRDHVQSATDQTREMVKARLRHQDGTATIYGQAVKLLEYWNEIVVDEVLMLEQLAKDPVPVIPAFVYTRGSLDGRGKAQKMRDTYVKQFNVKADIPLVAIDPSVRADSAQGPFVLETAAEAAEVLV